MLALDRDDIGHLAVTAKRIGQLHLSRCAAFRFEERRGADKNADCACP